MSNAKVTQAVIIDRDPSANPHVGDIAAGQFRDAAGAGQAF